MEKALSLVKAAESPDNEELTSIYLRLASWYIPLQQPERAVTHYEQALEVSPDNQDALSGILTIRIDSGPEGKTHAFIIAMNEPNSKEPGLSRLASTLLSQADDYGYGSPLRSTCGFRSRTCRTKPMRMIIGPPIPCQNVCGPAETI